MYLLIVTGRSGAGKTVALNELEDLGYCCIDNLPADLLGTFIEYQKNLDSNKASTPHAVCIDTRSQLTSFQALADQIISYRASGIDIQIMYLDANDQTLIRRFSETRRKHPLTQDNKTLSEALSTEFELLSPLRLLATYNLDTTNKGLYETRDSVRNSLMISQGNMTLIIQSFGFKNGVPDGTDFVFDVRCLPNPFWIPELREKDGTTKETADFLSKSEDTLKMASDISTFISSWLQHYIENNRSYLTISIGCTGGFHRSVFVTHAVYNHLKAIFPDVLERHRDKDKH